MTFVLSRYYVETFKAWLLSFLTILQKIIQFCFWMTWSLTIKKGYLSPRILEAKRSTKKLNRHVLVILALSRCYSSIFDGLVAKKKLSPAPATVSQDTGEFYYYNSSLVELGKPITISCNANKVRNVKTLRGLTIILAQELATCMFKPPYSNQWNETYVRSGDEVYIKENSRIG